MCYLSNNSKISTPHSNLNFIRRKIAEIIPYLIKHPLNIPVTPSGKSVPYLICIRYFSSDSFEPAKKCPLIRAIKTKHFSFHAASFSPSTSSCISERIACEQINKYIVRINFFFWFFPFPSVLNKLYHKIQQGSTRIPILHKSFYLHDTLDSYKLWA